MNARPYALTSAVSCTGITQKRPGIVPVTTLASTHTEKFSTDRRTLDWDLLNKEAGFRGEGKLFGIKLRGSRGWSRWKQSGGKGTPLDDMAVVVADYILIDGVESVPRKNNGKHSNQKKAA
jgi:hypothetical protein